MRSFRMVAVASVMLVSCQGDKGGAPTATPEKSVSISTVMRENIVPGSEVLWNAVGETYEGDKPVRIAPSTPEQWKTLEDAVRTMKQGLAHLEKGKLVVAAPGEKIQGDGVADAPQAAQIQARIDADSAAFKADSKAMMAILDQFDAAVGARNVDQIMDLGGKLDEVCEACHRKYWYPDQKVIP